MWKDSIRNIVVIFQPNILRIVGFYVRHSAINFNKKLRIFLMTELRETERYKQKRNLQFCERFWKNFREKNEGTSMNTVAVRQI